MLEPRDRATKVASRRGGEHVPGTALGAALTGLLPLALLVVLAGMALLAAVVARLLVAPQGFFAQQQDTVIVLAVGLGLAALAYLASVVRALRRVGQWQRSGATGQATAALLALVLTAVVVALPVVLALALPQHPAP